MNAARLVVEHGEVRLGSGVGNSRQSWALRRSLLVTVEDGAGTQGLGEATPLEGYAPDTLAEAAAALEAVPSSALQLARLASGLEPALSSLAGVPAPSARFALECALSHLAATQSGRSLDEVYAKLLGRSGAALLPTPPAAALLDLGGNVARQLEHARSTGARTFKAKLGRAPERELEGYGELVARLHSEEAVRLDLNGATAPRDWLERFADPRLEFVEEPFAELGDPEPLAVPVALDESVFRTPELVRRWLDAGALSALVLKPMTLGLVRTLAWVEAARTARTPVVLSHCFDGAVAFRHTEALARAMGPGRFATGLGAHPALSLWSGRLAAPEAPGDPA